MIKTYTNLEILKAIDESIEKWRGNVFRGEMNYGSSMCPLCVMFNSNDCVGCPISSLSGYTFCYGTPYIKIISFNDRVPVKYNNLELSFLYEVRLKFINKMNRRNDGNNSAKMGVEKEFFKGEIKRSV